MSNPLGSIRTSIQANLTGRPAIIVAVLIALVLFYWLTVQNYSQHPIFTWVMCGGLFLLFTVVVFLIFFASPKPSEANPTSVFVGIDKLGLSLPPGSVNANEVSKIIREMANIRPLPAPSGTIEGKAIDESSHVPLTRKEAEAILAEDEDKIAKLIDALAMRFESEIKKIENGSSQQISLLPEKEQEEPQT